MLSDEKILVVLDGGAHCHEALKRARLFAEFTQLEIELIWFGKLNAWQGLEGDIAALERDFAVVTRVSKGSLLDDVKQSWEQQRFALLIKGCDEQHRLFSFSQSIDWHLLRETPCPVLLVKQDKPWGGRPVLAAINPMSSKVHQVLHDQNVLRLAAYIAGAAKSPLYSAIATPPPMLGADADAQVPELIEKKARYQAMEMFNDIDIYPDDLFFGEGPAEFYVAETANQQNAALVVISTRARGGLSAALLGNTAEQMLDRLDCDVLVLRPGLSVRLPSDTPAH